jgi:hypothetical protein
MVEYGNYNYRTGLNFWFSNGGIKYGNEKKLYLTLLVLKLFEKHYP